MLGVCMSMCVCVILGYSRLIPVRARPRLLQWYRTLYCIITHKEDRRAQGKGNGERRSSHQAAKCI